MSYKKLTIVATISLLSVVNTLQRNCYTHNVVIKSEPYLKFNVTPGNECREYCKYEAECETFSFNIDRPSECSLYREEESSLIYEINKASHFIFRVKDCDDPELSEINMTEQDSLSAEKSFTVFKRSDSYKCVEVNLTETKESWSLGYQLYWTSACETAQQWEVIPVEEDVTSYPGCDVVKVKMDQGNMCFSAVKLEISITLSISPTVFLQACANGSENGSDLSQKFIMCIELVGVWSLKRQSYLPLILPVSNSLNWLNKISLSSIDNITGNELERLQNGPCKDISVTEGSILYGEKVPFFLPGETITVTCNKGFGVKVAPGIYDQEFTTNCSSSRTPLVCQTLPGGADTDGCKEGQMDVKSSESSMTVELLVLLASLSNFLNSL